jgi:hypothetical protein
LLLPLEATKPPWHQLNSLLWPRMTAWLNMLINYSYRNEGRYRMK